MNNRILQATWFDASPAGSEAEVWISVTPQFVTPTTELRGRLLGPRCPYSQTVEVAYTLRPLRQPADGPTPLTRRVVIPEASLWEPQCPFVYEGTIELWQDGICADRAPMHHGLRSLALTPAGLRLNGRVLALHGGQLDGMSEPYVLPWRRRGWNLLLVDVTPATIGIWEIADRFGFLVIGRLPDVSAATLELAARLSAQPSCLGWILPAGAEMPALQLGRVGVVLRPGEMPPAAVAFVVGGMELVGLGLPVLLLENRPGCPPPVFGYVEPL